MSQAMMEYAKPVMEYFYNGVVKDMNDAFQIATRTWNYTSGREYSGGGKERDAIISIISKTLKMNQRESIELFDYLVERKNTLLPPEIQPAYPMIMFMKKGEPVQISKFDYASLDFPATILPPNEKDHELVDMLDKMDAFIAREADYDSWEKFYLEMEDVCKSRFENWMRKKGIQKEYEEEFPFCVGIYLNFVYRYGHDQMATLKTVALIHIEEFFFDHILRKVSTEPPEYVLFPPAIKTFYLFLAEKGYMRDPGSIIKSIDDIEPDFFNMLKEQFE